MRKKKKVWILCWILIAIMMISACDTIKYYQRDSFYREGSDCDRLRFPLIKPYFAVYVNEESGWQIPLGDISNQNFRGYINVPYVEKILVENNVIMIYTPYQASVIGISEFKIINWFVLEPEKELESGFENEEDFLEYLDEIGIDEPEWMNPDDVSLQFDETRCLDWIPDCEESE